MRSCEYMYERLFLGSFPLVCVSVFMPVHTVLISFVICFEIRTCETSKLCSLSRLFWLFGVP